MNDRNRLTGSQLKWIAMVSMLLDHTGAILVLALLRHGVPYHNFFYCLYWFLRIVGRFAFPIYCFLLVEGFCHTRSVPKYALRLALFALISEIPFDLAFNGAFLEFGSNNVFFTLLMGLLCIWGIRTLGVLGQKRFPKLPEWLVTLFAGAVSIGVVCLLTRQFMHCDYGYPGVLAIALMYLLRKRPALAFGVGVCVLCLSSLLELFALIMLFPICLYNGRRGRPMKLGPYIFYPAHILALYGITQWILR